MCFLWKIFFQKRNQKQLFLMGHPRSGSSLLMHILTSNNEIIGFGEYFTVYHSHSDLINTEFDIRRKRKKLFKNYFYIANQILHSSRTPNLNILKNVKIIFLIRNPIEALSSSAILSKKKKGVINKEEIVNEYIQRLKFFIKLFPLLDKDQWIFITYEDLTENTNTTLNDLNQFLNLKASLSSSYDLQKFTQISGDPSINITKGTIIKTKSKLIDFEDIQLLKAKKVYNEAHNLFTS
jgi:hypothetical protein